MHYARSQSGKKVRFTEQNIDTVCGNVKSILIKENKITFLLYALVIFYNNSYEFNYTPFLLEY